MYYCGSMTTIIHPSIPLSQGSELVNSSGVGLNDVHCDAEIVTEIEVSNDGESLASLKSMYEKLNRDLSRLTNKTIKYADDYILKFNVLNQKLRRKNVEFHGLDCSNKMKTDKELVVRIGNYFGVEFTANDIEDMRLRKAKKYPLIVSFYSETIPKLLLAKKRTIVTNSVVFGNDNKQRIYINENLTRYYLNLYFEARKMAKDHDFEFIWVKAGKVYVRKNADSKAKRIDSLDELRGFIAGLDSNKIDKV